MIATINRQQQQTNWQCALRDTIDDPAELFSLLNLAPNQLGYSVQAMQDFVLRVPKEFVARMQKGNPRDPLLLQILPQIAEMQTHPLYSQDPLAENKVNPIPGLLHKYKSRVLLTASSSCGIHCRYCFRRHFPYADNNPSLQGWQQAFTYIAEHPEINEVIFSGGDPLTAPDSYLAKLTSQLANIPHIKTLRIHTRMPIIIPQRITDSMLDWFCGSRLKSVLITHCNHPQEIDNQVAASLQRLKNADVTLLNQSVLLKDVNDDAACLIELSEKLFSCDVLPYYLHLLDKVQGSQHFDLPPQRAQQLLGKMMCELPGYLVPRLVQEVPGMPCKMPVMAEF